MMAPTVNITLPTTVIETIVCFTSSRFIGIYKAPHLGALSQRGPDIPFWQES